jgi:hypothetical protein
MNRLPLLLAILLTSSAHSAVYACSCGTGAPPVEFNQARAIFIGKVLGGTESWEEKTQDGIPHQLEAGNVRVVVEESFKGDLSGEVIVSVASMKGTSCGDYGLKRHVSYIIYAYGGKDGNGLYTGPCSRTSPANGEYAKEDLDFLRNLPAPGTGGNLQGHIWADLKAGGATPLPNVKVNIRAGDKLVSVVSTDSKGFFEVKKLQPGSYNVEPEFPENYMTERKSAEVTIEDRGAAVVGFEAYLNGIVLGTIVDRDGLGFNSAFLHLVERGVEKGKSIYGHSTGEDGSFLVSGVPPGEYVLYLELAGKSYKDNKRFYYPGAYEVAGAASIKVELGGKVEGLRFFLPEEFKVRTIQGQVIWEDGKPAANVEVMLLCPRSAKEYGFAVEFSPTTARTDEEGKFELEGFTGEVYWLEARGVKTGGDAEKSVEVHSAPKKLTLVENLKDLRLSLSEKGFSGSGCGDKK